MLQVLTNMYRQAGEKETENAILDANYYLVIGLQSTCIIEFQREKFINCMCLRYMRAI